MAAETFEYDELVVRLAADAEGRYDVVVSSASGSVGRASFEPPFTDADLLRFRRTIDPATAGRKRDTNSGVTQAFGERLFEALLGDRAVHDVYVTGMGEAEARGRGVRVMIDISAAPALAFVPWEFLYDRPRFPSEVSANAHCSLG